MERSYRVIGGFNRNVITVLPTVRGSGVDKEQLPRGLRPRDITQTIEIVEDSRYG